MEEVGLRVLEHSYMQVPALLAQLKDEDPGVACQAIVSGTKFFYSTLQELAQQFHRHDKVERWVEETWMQMIEFKDAVFSLVFEAAAVRTRLLALKFLETCILLFTPDAVNTNRLTSGGKEHRFNISWLANDHPVLDLAKLASEANRLFTSLLDMLRSSSSIPGPLTITIVNCLASIARKRTEHYGHILSALLDFHSKSETRSGHAASLQYSVRSALLGFLRCTHPVFIESRDRLVQELRSMNAGDAVDQVLRQVDKLMRNNERSSREARMVKEEQSSTQLPLSGDPIKRKLLPVDNEERDNDVEMPSKRLRYTSNGRSPDLVQIHGSADDNPVINGVPSEAPMVDNDVNPVEQMITVIAALLAEGERAAESLELLISQIHPDLLADIVITNMKHLPKTAPLPKQGALSSNAQNISAVSAAQITDSTSLPVLPPLSAQQGSIPAAVTFSTPPPDYSGSATLQVDSRRDPRRDPRRLDPRRVAVPSEAPLLPLAEEATHVSSILEGPAFVNRTTSLTSAPITEHISSHFVPDAEVDVKSSTLLVPENEVMPKEEEADESREILPSSDVNVLVNRALSPDHAVNESPITLTSFKIEPTDAACTSYIQESDEDSPPVSNTSACEETCEDLPEVPSYVYLTEKQRQTIKKLAVEQIVKSYKQLKDQEYCRTRNSLIARLVSWMEADDLVIVMVQQDIVLDYKDQQGHDLVMHILYHLHGLITTEGEQSPGAADLYEKFLLGVAKSLLDTLPASDKSFSRLLGEAPMLTDSIMRLLENLCCPDGSDMRGKDVRDDRVTQGLGAVWSLILGRPLNRLACLSIALKCAVHSEDDTRAKAIRLVSNKLYQLNYVSETIEQYAKNMLLSAVDCTTDADASESISAGVVEETSISGPQIIDSGISHADSQAGASMSFPEAQRLVSLYFSLCTKKPGLLQLVFDVYARAGKIVKQAIHRHIPILLRALGSSYSQLLRIISDPPMGSENLLMLVLQILAEQTTPPPDLISTVKHLYETKLKDATILIPMLSSLSKNEVLPIFPRLVDLPLDKFQQALAHILQGSAHTGPALTPAEVLVAIHDIVPEKEKIALKKVTDACTACFEQRTVFTQHVLAKALNQMVDRTPLPLLFMRTVIQAIDAFPTLVEFVMEVLSKLVNRQIWRMPKLWVGFLKCVSQTQPHSFQVLLKLPAPQLENALNKYSNLRGPLASYSSQPSIKSSLPSSTLAVLGLASETHPTQPHLSTPLHTSDSSSVRGATST
ncbi:uncharacterized protein LOC110685469 [Chenopodium quinoa]|uniref:uncharacterized protein LOC110685469 n=1 Tax=Chenopodium quinoa TaxID=63459 RepID=UPI000B7801E8|nr:uncharacterized protein LOC110685469 [Chenopodium quinoa]XP_021717693.1 uncharacterized protein LOC110685469 [Chenopodium quinoa]